MPRQSTSPAKSRKARQRVSPLISIIVPVYNGAGSIGRVVDDIKKAFGRRPHEIVLVNDCSPDASHDVCLALHRQHDHITYSINSGEHNAVMAGLHHATGDYAAIIDDDSQNDPADILRMAELAAAEGHDVVYAFYDKKMHSPFRNFGSWFNGIVATVMLNKPRDLYLCSFKMINRFVIDSIIRYNGPYPYIDGLILRVTHNIGKLEAAHYARAVGRSNYTPARLIRLWLNMFTSFSVLPLRVATLFGFAFAVLGFILGIYVMIEKIIFGVPLTAHGWASLIIVTVVFAAIQLISLGIIGEYVGRLFLSVNQKPQFSVRRAYFRFGAGRSRRGKR